jgi:hypothetical protein
VLLAFTLTDPSATLLDTNSDASAAPSDENTACTSDDSAAIVGRMLDELAVVTCVAKVPCAVGQ